MTTSLAGIAVVVSPMLPLYPSHTEDARRRVRELYDQAGILKWLGERRGPLPGEPTHSMMGMDHGRTNDGAVLFVSRELHETIRREWAP